MFFSMSLFLENCTDSATQQPSNTKEDLAIAQKVKALMSKMTLTDKVGEMTQLAIDMVSVGDPYNLKEPHQLDPDKLRKTLLDLRVGSILNVGGHAYSKEHWHEIISKIQDIAMNEKPTGIPVLYGIDAIHGVNYTVGATLFPQEIALAATWNPSTALKMGEISAYETRASAIPWNFSPVLGVGRNPLWPRFWETLGEDPFLVSKMGAALIEGYEGNDIANPEKVVACMKHFLGYSMPLLGKDRTQAWIPQRELQEYFVPSFQAAVGAGVHTAMINSAEMNGIPVHCNPKILKDLLRDQLGFKGLAVSDWEDIKYLYTRHHVAKDYKDAIKLAINAGVDMSMVAMDYDFPVLLKELVEEGEVPMSRINESVARILTLKFQLGLFEHPYYPLENYPDFGSEKHANASFQAALESLTLLKNEKNTLPISKKAKILVTGPTAHSLNALNGGWTNTWQGDEPKYNTPGKKTILEAIQDKIGAAKVTFVEGTSVDEAINIPQAAAAARRSKVAIVCIGEMTYTEKPGDIDELELPEAQQNLVKAIAKTGTPIVLVLVEGRPRTLHGIEPDASAVLMTYLSGNEGGRAIAEVLFGDYNPNGKLPFTYPRYANSLDTYDHKYTDEFSRDFSQNGFNPQWEFGSGLSYTTFEYSNLKLNANQISKDKPLQISVTLTNTGKRAGQEVVQLFVSDEVASITPPVKRLRGFQKTNLQAGESKTISFTLKLEDLAFVGLDNEWVTEPGEFEAQIGGLKEKFSYAEE